MKINTQNTQQLFLDHLRLEGNDRILFSGKFGTGKSYFLGEFFKTYDENYDVFWLSPVDYVVGANGDIFEWIKIDIAKRLVDQLDEDKPNKCNNLLVQSYLYRNIGSLCTKLIEIVSSKLLQFKTGVDVLDAYKVMLDGFELFKKEHNESQKSHLKILSGRVSDETNTRGSIFEDDIISQTIRASVELLKFQNNKESVLIIDDLDRLDPEHVFRILNILSAHNNHFDSNKFGFSKVIIVCDIDNIQHLFQHKYGPQSDFDGYIEKYYTYMPFNFSIEKAISFYCESNYFIENLDNPNKKVLSYLLQLFFKHNKLNARSLKKIHHYVNEKALTSIEYDFTNYGILHNCSFINSESIVVDYSKYHFIKVVQLLIVAFGSMKSFIRAFEDLKGHTIDDAFVEPIITSVALIAHISKYKTYNESIFFKRKSYDRGQDITYEKPTFYSFNIQEQVPLIWDSRNSYEKDNYFEIGYPLAIYDMYQKKRRGLSFSVETLLVEIRSIVALIEDIQISPQNALVHVS